ncbi:MAG TPA: alpha-amylase family glycosyl hydrolase, partial [Rhizobiaceae bacterium]|nr:alpha-amylase family glycosyl hydrolase [Rhizobiaceae bacterium]
MHDDFGDVRLGARLNGETTDFAVYAPDAAAVWVCLYDAQDRETMRLAMRPGQDGVWRREGVRAGAGQLYGYRADGVYDPAQGLWFDPKKLLVDPFATRIDRPFRHDPALGLPRDVSVDTAPLMSKAVVEAHLEGCPPLPLRGISPARGENRHPPFIYELNVRGFTMLHPDVPKEARGTLAALKHKSVIVHLQKLGVSHVELMPVAAWIDERHLPPLGLANAWGYNPVTMLALDPRLAPGGIADLRAVTNALRKLGIGVILDVVFNHTGESDAHGTTLSLRGLCPRQAFRRNANGSLANDTGTGNTLACDHPFVVRLCLSAMRHFVVKGGVDGFRFDLAPVLGRTAEGFDRDAPLLVAMRNDPVLRDRLLIAEPWDIGPGGYQLGAFGEPFLEWNDRYRDDVRRFWRGDAATIGALATRLAGSSDVFRQDDAPMPRSVNFIAAHDGFTLADLVSHRYKHNDANGEDNRDGHGENFSWNNGMEGATGDPAICEARACDMRALLSTL